MRKLSKQQIEQVLDLLKKGQILPEEYKNLLFESKKEYELVYNGKEREEDIIAETMAVPLQPIKTLGKGEDNGWVNKLIFGDNLQVLKTLYEDSDVKGKVKLIYIDPPFATKKEFHGSREQKAYQDKLIGAKFLEFLRKRLVFLKEILSDDGSVYVHLDWKMAHYVKVLMDEIFDKNNFRNEIIWHYHDKFATGGKSLDKNHDVIFHYSKSADFVGNEIRVEKEEATRRALRKKVGGKTINILDERGNKIYGEFVDKRIDDVWDIGRTISSNEYLGYPTQKKEALIERILRYGSSDGDLVADFFCGAGTTLAVAEKLGRRWIGCDMGKLAIYTTQKRMLNLKSDIGNKGKNLVPKSFTVYNAGLYDYKLIKALPWNEYRDFALKLFQCRNEKHKVSGIELDGYLGEDHVLVFQWHDGHEIILDRGFIDDLHKALGKKVGRKFLIIAPASTVVFLEDYIQKDDTKYYVLRIPYSIIEEIHEKGFEAIRQPVSEADVNDVIDAVGFDFIQTPDVECEYKIRKAKKNTLFDGYKEAVIKIKKFKSNILSRKPVEFKNLETLSMVMADYNFNDDVFDIDQYWFSESIVKDGGEIRFDPKKAKEKIMIIYMDIFGNEKREVKTLKDFSNK